MAAPMPNPTTRDRSCRGTGSAPTDTLAAAAAAAAGSGGADSVARSAAIDTSASAGTGEHTDAPAKACHPGGQAVQTNPPRSPDVSVGAAVRATALRWGTKPAGHHSQDGDTAGPAVRLVGTSPAPAGHAMHVSGVVCPVKGE